MPGRRKNHGRKDGSDRAGDHGSKGGRSRRTKDSTLDKVAPPQKTRSSENRSRGGQDQYHVPSDHEIIESIEEVMARNHIVKSQSEFTELVKADLRKRDPKYTVTGERLRRVAIEKAGLTVEIHGRESESGRAISRCPVCKSPLRATKNVTIYGGTVTLGYKCTSCPYWTGIKRRIPTRYVFYKRKGK